MVYKNVFVIQPYNVGQKERKSTAFIIPAAIVKRYQIDKNSILILKSYDDEKLTIEIIANVEGIARKNKISVEKSFADPHQQVSDKKAGD